MAIRYRAGAALVVGLTVAGCGGGHHYAGVSPKTWAQNVCQAWNGWQQDTSARLSSFQTKTATLTTAADQRDQLVNFFDALRQTSDQLVTTIKAAGFPAIKDGPAAAGAYASTFAAFPSAYADAKTKAAALPTDDNGKYETGVKAISASLTTAYQQITSRFTEINRTYRDPKLTAALSQPACKSLSVPTATTAPPQNGTTTTAAPAP